MYDEEYCPFFLHYSSASWFSTLEFLVDLHNENGLVYMTIILRKVLPIAVPGANRRPLAGINNGFARVTRVTRMAYRPSLWLMANGFALKEEKSTQAGKATPHKVRKRATLVLGTGNFTLTKKLKAQV